ncbi:hypothetical protein SCLCIDRAFT_30346 [Scleroderma citrinum Foug A]|uniref:Uncharacterized protein n=1 Tax=Scleroderma citrinum Foug A TaxID=1036808 RepID=A0A0C2ZSC0_9AGAM|nr:hypothetical protein SCLCIDRAFT_30346 [Scleroderma citrinum Foug A]
MPDLIEQVEDSFEWAAEQEAQRKAKEERKQAKEEAKKKAKEDAQKRAEFQVQWKADSERKVREKAKAKVAAEVMRAQIAQKAGQGKKPKPKPKQRWAASQRTPNEEVQGWYPPHDRCQKSSDSKGCILPDNAHTPMCHQCQKMKVKCYFEVPMVMMKRSASGEKHKESKTLRTRRAVADTASTEEIEEALGGFSVAGPSTWLDPVAQVLDRRLGEVISAINRNTRELVQLGGKMDGFMAQPEETKEEEEKSDNMSDVDAEGEDADE